jgi:hypothetical protein
MKKKNLIFLIFLIIFFIIIYKKKNKENKENFTKKTSIGKCWDKLGSGIKLTNENIPKEFKLIQTNRDKSTSIENCKKIQNRWNEKLIDYYEKKKSTVGKYFKNKTLCEKDKIFKNIPEFLTIKNKKFQDQKINTNLIKKAFNIIYDVYLPLKGIKYIHKSFQNNELFTTICSKNIEKIINKD